MGMPRATLVIRLLLVDDSAEFLRVAAGFLATDPRIEIVGQVRSGVDALKCVARLAPDVVLIDVVMPEMDGFETTRRIKSRPDAPRVIILTLHDNVEYCNRAHASGADGYVSKSELGDRLLPLIQALCTERFG
jgi:DNA-binding NarL/FixJ family response regulator